MRNKSTVTAGLLLQSLISRALDDNEFVAMAGIDLSAAFDIVDVDLLVKRLVMFLCLVILPDSVYLYNFSIIFLSGPVIILIFPRFLLKFDAFAYD